MGSYFGLDQRDYMLTGSPTTTLAENFPHGEITTDLGEDLTGIERTLADAYCITIVLLDDLSTRILLGQQIDMDALAQVIRCQVTLASRLGIARKPKDVSVTLDDYLSTGRKRSRRPPRQINGAIEYADAD